MNPEDGRPPGARTGSRRPASTDDLFSDLNEELLREADDFTEDVFDRDTALPPPTTAPVPEQPPVPPPLAPEAGASEPEPEPSAQPEVFLRSTARPETGAGSLDSEAPTVPPVSRPAPGEQASVPPPVRSREPGSAPPLSLVPITRRGANGEDESAGDGHWGEASPLPNSAEPGEWSSGAPSSWGTAISSSELDGATSAWGSGPSPPTSAATARPVSAPTGVLQWIDSHTGHAVSAPPMAGLRAPSSTPATRPSVDEMRRRYAVGDYSGSLETAEALLAANPDQAEARNTASQCRTVLTQMYCAKIGSLDQVVKRAMGDHELQWLTLDHRAGFLLSLVDDQSTVDELLDISGMSRLSALKILAHLCDQRVVRVG